MLQQHEDKLVCPHCGRIWAFDENLKAGDPCPSDDCNSQDAPEETEMDVLLREAAEEIERLTGLTRNLSRRMEQARDIVLQSGNTPISKQLLALLVWE